MTDAVDADLCSEELLQNAGVYNVVLAPRRGTATDAIRADPGPDYQDI